jgi:nucleoside-diphosphate-sugar epimerase
MRALLLGGTRFVGLRLLRALHAAGHQVTILNRGRRQADLPSGIDRLEADRRDDAGMRRVLQGRARDFDVVFDATGYQRPNLEPVVDVLGEHIRRYVFISSFAVYARMQTFPIREDFPVIEPGEKTGGLDAYGADKVRCECYLLEMHRERALPAVILRSPAIYGPENWMDDREGSYFARLAMGRKILIAGRGETLIHFGHVDDLAAACIAVSESPAAVGEVFNVTGPEAITVNALIDSMAEAVGVKAQKVYLPYGVGRESIDGLMPYQSERCAVHSIEKLNRMVGFWPLYDVRSGMAHTYAWWKQHRGLERVKFEPGKLGYDVDLAAEDALIARWDGAAAQAAS